MKKYIFLCGLFLVFLISGICLGDTLYLKNSTQVTGKIIKQDDEKIVLRVGEAEDATDVTFFNDEVLRIDKTDVPSHIELPFAQGKGIRFPRPVMTNIPISTNLTLEEEEQQTPQDEPREELKQEEQLEVSADETNQPEESQKASSEQDTKKQETPSLQESLVDRDQEFFIKQKKIVEELVPLLNKEESDYFMYINSVVEKDVGQATLYLTIPHTAASRDNGLMNDMSAQINGIIDKLANTTPPYTFAIFHKKYLVNLSLVNEVFYDVSKGNILDSQTKLSQIKNKKIELQKELESILEEKKKSNESKQ